MGLVDAIRGMWRREAAQQPAEPAGGRLLVRRSVQGRYDAAATTDGNRRHWANADGLSADAAASPEVRRKLRNRARYEVANNSYARGIVTTLANDVIGTGPRLQMLTPDDEANRIVEARFAAWSRAIGLPAKLRTMRMARAESGEAFMLLAQNPRLRSPIQLDLRLIEADQVATPAPVEMLPSDPRAIDGIVFDDFGNPVLYHVLRQHPGDMRWTTPLAFDPIPADAVIHYFRPERPGQSRGIPDITPALPLFAQLRRFTLAVLAAAETAADFAGVLQSDASAEGDSEDLEVFDTFEAEKRMVVTLPKGWSLNQFKAEQPATTYREFKHELLNEITRCLNMPFNVASGNSSGYNYASGRLDHQTYYRSIRVDQDNIGCIVLDRILDAFLDEAVLVEGLLPQSMRLKDANRDHQWFWDGQEHVDPTKEATAQAIRLASRTTSLAREYARQGLDWEAELRQIARERQRMEELGIPDQNAPAQPEPANADQEDAAQAA